jgi:hypothetical protein
MPESCPMAVSAALEPVEDQAANGCFSFAPQIAASSLQKKLAVPDYLQLHPTPGCPHGGWPPPLDAAGDGRLSCRWWRDSRYGRDSDPAAEIGR